MTHDYAADDRAAAHAWRAEQSAARLARFEAKQPRAFAKPGNLHPDIAAWCDRYAAGEPGNLVLIGGIGVGKTWSLWAAARHLITNHHWRGRFESATAYAFQRAVAPPLDDDQVHRWLGADLLALDDLGAQRVSEWDAGHLAGIINDRSERERPFIVTSNDGDLATILGPRSASRTRENTTVIVMTGDDLRKAR